jgi:excisionase family DNA binding protein
MEVTHTQLSDERIGIGDAARLAQLSQDTLRRAVKAGRLPSSKTPGGQHRFLRSDIEALLAPVGAERIAS